VPKCRHDHRLKQEPTWKVDQLADGAFQCEISRLTVSADLSFRVSGYGGAGRGRCPVRGVAPIGDLDTAAVIPDRRAERRRRLAEPDLEFQAFCTCKGLPASLTLQLERVWDAWQAERYQRGETGLCRQPVPATLTIRPPCSRSGNWTP